ncbi:copper amine oxidase N-terminal domain-containing protein [Paenibacillus albus]|nr:copper amine oxidase N-terminal domain-containing protein [Paenibacillus albus]
MRKLRFVIHFLALLLITNCFTFPAFAESAESSIVNVNGSVIVVDGKPIAQDNDPISVSGTLLVQLKPIMTALNASFSWDDSSKTITGKKNKIEFRIQINSSSAILNGIKVSLPTPAIQMNGKIMIPLRFLTDTFGAQLKITPYPQMPTLTFDSKEIAYRKAYDDAVKTYNKFLNTYKTKQQALEKAKHAGAYTLQGQIFSLDPFAIYGRSTPQGSYSSSDPGFLIDNSYIVITNPDKKNIRYGKTYFGTHYYLGTESHNGTLLFVFGPQPKSTQKKIKEAEKAVNSSGNDVNTAKKAIATKKENLVSYVKNKYGTQLSSDPKNYIVLFKYAMHLDNLSVFLTDKNLQEMSNSSFDQAIKLDPVMKNYRSVYFSKADEWSKRKETLKKIATVDPYILLNTCFSDRDYYEAASVLSEVNTDLMEYALQKASISKNPEIITGIQKIRADVAAKIHAEEQNKQEEARQKELEQQEIENKKQEEEQQKQEADEKARELAKKNEQIRQIKQGFLDLMAKFEADFNSRYSSMSLAERAGLQSELQNTYLVPLSTYKGQVNKIAYGYFEDAINMVLTQPDNYMYVISDRIKFAKSWLDQDYGSPS